MHYKIKPISGGLGNRFLSVLGVLGDLERRHGTGFSYSILDTILRTLNLQQSPKSPRTMISGLQTGSAIFSNDIIVIDEHFVCAHHKSSEGSVGVHFRGGDFAVWKPHSIIPAGYFIENIQRLGSKKISLCSDDAMHPVYLAIKKWLTDNEYDIIIFGKSMLEDVYALADCTHIVASPSTFSLTAAILGGKNITFPHQFAEIEALEGDLFWRYVLDGRPSKYVNLSLS